MRLSKLEYGVAYDVVTHAHDLEQIYTLRGDRDPVPIVRNVMAAANFSWVAWHGGRPVALFGAAPLRGGVWQAYTLATPEFGKVVAPLTRFIKRTVIPTLFNEVGVHRLECLLHQDNRGIHRWAGMLGFQKEFVKERYAPDGAAYHGYCISTNPTKPGTLPDADVSPGARRAGS